MSIKNNYLRDKTFYTNKTKVYEMDKIYSYDIDDKLDFEICENLYKIILKSLLNRGLTGLFLYLRNICAKLI